MLLLKDSYYTVSYMVETYLSESLLNIVRGCFPIDEAKRITDVATLGDIIITDANVCKLSVLYGYMRLSAHSTKRPLVVFSLESPMGKAFVIVDDFMISTYGAGASFVLPTMTSLESGNETLECLRTLMVRHHRMTTESDIQVIKTLLDRTDFVYLNVVSLD